MTPPSGFFIAIICQMPLLYCTSQHNTNLLEENLYKNAPNIFNIDNIDKSYLQYYSPQNSSQYNEDSMLSPFKALKDEEMNYNELYNQLQSLENNANLMGIKRLLVLKEIAKLHDIEKRYQESVNRNSQITEENKNIMQNIKKSLRKLVNFENIIFENLFLKYNDKEKRNNQLEFNVNNQDFTDANLYNKQTTVLPNDFDVGATLHFPKKRGFTEKYDKDNTSSESSNKINKRKFNSSRQRMSEFSRLLNSFIRNANKFDNKINDRRKHAKIKDKITYQLNKFSEKLKEFAETNFNKSETKSMVNNISDIPLNNNFNNQTKVYSSNKLFKLPPKLSKLNKLSFIFNNSKPIKKDSNNTASGTSSNDTNKFNSFNKKYEMILSLYNKSKLPSIINAYKNDQLFLPGKLSKQKKMNVEKLFLMPLSIGIMAKSKPSTQLTDLHEETTLSLLSQLKSQKINEVNVPFNITALVTYKGHDIVFGGTFQLKTLNETVLQSGQQISI